MEVLRKQGYQFSALFTIFFILIEVQLTTNALLIGPRSFTTEASQVRQMASINRNRLIKFLATETRKFSSTRTSQMVTPIGGGAYQEVSQKELLEGVENIPVLLKRPEKLKNKYYGLRHGESDANMEGIISSDPDRGSKIHGLTVSGRVQARRAAGVLIETVKRENLQNIIFLSSNFTRARETAVETLKAMQCIVSFEEEPFREYALVNPSVDNTEATSRTAKTTVSTVVSDIHYPEIADSRVSVIVTNLLRERFFGDLDGKDLIYYNKVWPIDAVDSENVRDDVESVGAVVRRVAALVEDLEDTYEGKSIVLTSHADTLQIMQTYLSFQDPRTFSQYRFKNGEVRDMELLPDPVPMIYRGFFK